MHIARAAKRTLKKFGKSQFNKIQGRCAMVLGNQERRHFSPLDKSQSQSFHLETKLSNFIEDNLNHGVVTVWTKGDNCERTGRQTQQVKKLLLENNIEFEEIRLDQEHSGKEQFISCALTLHSGYSGFPNIFFGQEHIGGLDDLKAHVLDQNSVNRAIQANGITLSSDTEATEDEREGPKLYTQDIIEEKRTKDTKKFELI